MINLKIKKNYFNIKLSKFDLKLKKNYINYLKKL